MATFVFVRGDDASTEPLNRLTSGMPVHTVNCRLGGRVWDMATPALNTEGHRTFSPTLIDEHNCNLHVHIEQICHIVTEKKSQGCHTRRAQLWRNDNYRRCDHCAGSNQHPFLPGRRYS
jgi:hypothetical protein